MVTGASTADLALVLVDARKGVLEQSRRHAFIASLLRIPHLVVCVNKMDLVDYDEDVFDRDRRRVLAAGRPSSTSTTSPSSRSRRCTATTSSTAPSTCPGTRGPPLLYHLEHVHVASDRNLRRRALPGAVGDPADDRRAPRLPRLRRPGRRRRAPPRRRGGRAAVAARRPRIAAIDTFDGRARRRRSRRCR